MSPPAQNALPSPLRIATRIFGRRIDCARRIGERVDHRAVERIELVGAPQRQSRERPVEREFD